MEVVAGIIVAVFGSCLIGLAAMTVARPLVAEKFLESFASSPWAHYTEQTLRLIVGGAIVVFSPSMSYPDVFRLFGWLIVVTAVGLLLIPWRWHRRFGEWAIPLAVRHLRLFGVCAFVLGAVILHGASRAVLA